MQAIYPPGHFSRKSATPGSAVGAPIVMCLRGMEDAWMDIFVAPPGLAYGALLRSRWAILVIQDHSQRPRIPWPCHLWCEICRLPALGPSSGVPVGELVHSLQRFRPRQCFCRSHFHLLSRFLEVALVLSECVVADGPRSLAAHLGGLTWR